MAREDFLREMQASLAEQKRKIDEEQRAKAHEAEVIHQQTLTNWEELYRDVKSISQHIGIGFWPAEGHSFILRHGPNDLTVLLDGGVEYSGLAQGSFKPTVRGSELMYSLKERVSSEGEVFATAVEREGRPFTVAEIAEHLVRIAVGKP